MSERTPLKPIGGLKVGDRAAALPGPPARRATPAPAPSSADTPTTGMGEEPTASPGEETTHKQSRKPTRARTKVSDTADVTKSFPLFLPSDLAKRFRQAARDQRLSQVNLLLDALVSTQERLEDLVKNDQPQPAGTDDLFTRPASRVGGGGEDISVTLTLRTVSRNLDTIDRMTEKAGARSRSQLLRLALATHLNELADAST